MQPDGFNQVMTTAPTHHRGFLCAHIQATGAAQRPPQPRRTAERGRPDSSTMLVLARFRTARRNGPERRKTATGIVI